MSKSPVRPALFAAPLFAQAADHTHPFAGFDCGSQRVIQATATYMDGVRSGRIKPTMPTDAGGVALLAGTWPNGLPSSFETYYQAWIPDPGGPAGYAASNGLKGVTP
jgi:hypothetical protein